MSGGDPTARGDHGRFIMDRPYQEDHLTPEQRLAEHQQSKLPGPGGTTTVRVQMRERLGDERPLVRKLYDHTTKPRRRRKR